MDIFEKAVCFAVKAHSGMKRKDGDTPYLLHPMEAAAIAGTMTDDKRVLAAAVLHDVLEDTAVTEEELRKRFGDRITEYVLAETEDKRRGIPEDRTWEIRKKESLEDLAALTDPAVKILWLSDKLSNMRSFYRLYKEKGPSLWNKFNQTDPGKQKWYYCCILKLTEELKDHAAWQEYRQLTELVFGDPENE